MDNFNLIKTAIAGIALLTTLAAFTNNLKRKIMESFEKGTFGFDLQFLKSKDQSLIVLQDPTGNAQVALSAKYQGKVFTSTAQGLLGKSFGWINYRAFDQITPGAHINAVGGEDRFWLGPEGGQFSIFFKPGGAMVFDNWYTPAALDIEPWELISADKTTAYFTKRTAFSNYSGSQFNTKCDRKVSLLSRQQAGQMLGVNLNGVNSVAFETQNSITNSGNEAWTKETGTVCIWMLDMLTCGDGVTIVVPFRQGDEAKLGKIVTTGYFGKIPDEWLRITDKAVFLKADGKKRSKIGLSPQRAMPVSGSYDEENGILTIIKYTVCVHAEYVNQQWPYQDKPFTGDAVNAYNDGPLTDGSQLGPFYEIESSSPAAFLEPGESITHDHTVFHFAGEEAGLNKISEEVLGVGINEIETIFYDSN